MYHGILQYSKHQQAQTDKKMNKRKAAMTEVNLRTSWNSKYPIGVSQAAGQSINKKIYQGYKL